MIHTFVGAGRYRGGAKHIFRVSECRSFHEAYAEIAALIGMKTVMVLVQPIATFDKENPNENPPIAA